MPQRGNQYGISPGRNEQSLLSISNEFAGVTVRLVATRSGGLLEIRDVRHGLDVRLDALELESLTRLTAADRSVLVDPTRPGIAKPLAGSVDYDEMDEDPMDFESGFDGLQRAS